MTSFPQLNRSTVSPFRYGMVVVALLAGIVFSSPTAIAVMPTKPSVSAPKLVAVTESTTAVALKASIQAHVLQQARKQGLLHASDPADHLRIQWVYPAALEASALQKVPLAVLEIQSPLDKQFTGRTVVQVLRRDTGAQLQSIPIAISLQKEVWVSTDWLKPQQRLGNSNIARQTVWLTDDFAAVLDADKPLGVMAARTGIPKGTPLKQLHVTKPNAVEANHLVRVIVRTPSGVQIVTDGNAMAAGAIGDRVQVRLRPIGDAPVVTARAKVVYGQVIAENEILVAL